MTSDRNDTDFEARRVALFVVIAFVIAGVTAFVISITGGLSESPPVAPGVPFTIATVLVTTVYMFSPAIANVGTRIATKEGQSNLLVQPHLVDRWRWWVLAWLGPPVLIVLGAGCYFLVFPDQFDPMFTAFRASINETTGATGQPISLSPEILLAIQVLVALTVVVPINALFTFGEEFGWRAYLLPKLLPLGIRRAVVFQGIVWGIWHWPLIAMGYNYGSAYPAAPWLGFLAMAWATTSVGAFLAWATLRGGSVWPAVIGHAIFNAFAGTALYFTRGNPVTVLGPLPIGFIGALPWLALGVWLLTDGERFRPIRI